MLSLTIPRYPSLSLLIPCAKRKTRSPSGSSSAPKQHRRGTRDLGDSKSSSVFEQPPVPPWGQQVHDNYPPCASDLPPRFGNDRPDRFSGSAGPGPGPRPGPQSDNVLSEREYRNALSSQSAKDQRRLAGNTQYRRTASDTVTQKRSIPTAVNANSHGDGHNNHSNKNGVAEDDSGLPPSHSSKPTTPTNPSHPSVWRLQVSGERASSPVQSPATRRSKAPERSSVPTPTPTPGRSVSRTSSTGSVNSVQSQGSSTSTARPPPPPASSPGGPRAKNHHTPTSTPKNVRRAVGRIEEEFKAKHQQVKTQHQVEAQRLKSRLDDHRSKGTAATMGAKRPGPSETDNKRQSGGQSSRTGATNTGRNTRPDQQSRIHMTNGLSCVPAGRVQTPALSSGAMKMLEDYKDVNPNFTIRRREELQREENQQLEMLRQTIESRLKVTLPDNLPEALRDGVVLCHLANQIRPRSVASIHVPSPAVPKLTSAKCRRNVENFLDACRKIGVDQRDLCSVSDVVQSLRMGRVGTTVVRLSAFPRITPADFRTAHLCLGLFFTSILALALQRLYWAQVCVATDIMEERGVQRVAVTVASLVAMAANPRQSAV
ncbi:hypothetical protein ACOMHN_046590 [Nucella lapillus]